MKIFRVDSFRQLLCHLPIWYLSETVEKVFVPATVNSIKGIFCDNCPKLTIHAPAGSYAERYAEENNIPFVALTVWSKETDNCYSACQASETEKGSDLWPSDFRKDSFDKAQEARAERSNIETDEEGNVRRKEKSIPPQSLISGNKRGKIAKTA